MHIQGPTHIHAAQSINAPHQATRAQQSPTGPSTTDQSIDQLELTHANHSEFVDTAKQLPDIRERRVAEIRAQIEAGLYDSDDKLDIALDRFLDEVG